MSAAADPPTAAPPPHYGTLVDLADAGVTADQADDVAVLLAGVTADELAFVLAQLAAGRVDGRQVVALGSPCGCLLGTVAMARTDPSLPTTLAAGGYTTIYAHMTPPIAAAAYALRGPAYRPVPADMRPAELAFYPLRAGYTPATDGRAAALDALLRGVALSNPRHFGATARWLP